MITAIKVPMVAVAPPRMTVFLSASEAADRSNSTNSILCKVAFLKVRNVVATGENAALSSAA